MKQKCHHYRRRALPSQVMRHMALCSPTGDRWHERQVRPFYLHNRLESVTSRVLERIRLFVQGLLVIFHNSIIVRSSPLTLLPSRYSYRFDFSAPLSNCLLWLIDIRSPHDLCIDSNMSDLPSSADTNTIDQTDLNVNTTRPGILSSIKTRLNLTDESMQILIITIAVIAVLICLLISISVCVCICVKRYVDNALLVGHGAFDSSIHWFFFKSYERRSRLSYCWSDLSTGSETCNLSSKNDRAWISFKWGTSVINFHCLFSSSSRGNETCRMGVYAYEPPLPTHVNSWYHGRTLFYSNIVTTCCIHTSSQRNSRVWYGEN